MHDSFAVLINYVITKGYLAVARGGVVGLDIEAHLKQINGNEEAICPEWHVADFEPYRLQYLKGQKAVNECLADGIKPENIVLGGDLLDRYANFAGGTFIDDIESAEPEAIAIAEKWVRAGSELLRISKESNGVDVRLLARQLKHRWGFLPGVTEKRAQKIAAQVLDVRVVKLDLFSVKDTGAIDDELLWNLRYGAEHGFADDALYPPEIPQQYMPRESQYVGTSLSLWSRTPLGEPLSQTAVDKQAREMLSFEGVMKGFGKAPSDNVVSLRKPRTLEGWRSYFVHHHGAELVSAVSGLHHAVSILETGTAVAPSQPQDFLPHWQTLVSQTGSGTTTARLEGGGEITLEIS